MPVYKWGEEDSEADCCTWILRTFIWSVFVGVGIFLIIFGCDELATCEHSMLPMYILVTGCTIVAGCALSLLAAVILGCQLSWRNGGYYLMLLYGVFYFIWWLAGCYWTWVLGYAGCVQRVYIVALFITITPALSAAVAFFCRICNR